MFWNKILPRITSDSTTSDRYTGLLAVLPEFNYFVICFVRLSILCFTILQTMLSKLFVYSIGEKRKRLEN